MSAALRAPAWFLVLLAVSCARNDRSPVAAGSGGTLAAGSRAAQGGRSGASAHADAGASGRAAAGGGGAAGSAGRTSLTTLDPSQLPAPDPKARVIPNLDSAVIKIEPVDGARDYRASVMSDGVEVLLDGQGRETVNGATSFCAGQRQRAAPALPTPELMTQIEVTGLTAKTTFVVEAIDALCPFTGLYGLTDTSFEVGNLDNDPHATALRVPVPVLSEASVRKRYGSMIVNGHGPATQPGQPAEPVAPKVLKRWTVEVAPVSQAEAAARKTRDFFADFSQTTQPEWVKGGDNGDGTFHAPEGRGYSIAAYRNEDFIFYATNAELVSKSHVFYDRGQLHMLLADAGQGTMSSAMAIPRKLAHVSDDKYLHVTFESSANSTPRRYWWLSVCGPEAAGQTFQSNGLLKEYMVLTAGFFGADGLNPSYGRWNCLVVFPHDGIMTPVPADSGQNPQSSVIVMIHKAGKPDHESAVNVSPQQLNDAYPRSWYRMHDGQKVSTRGLLDEYVQRAPRVRFDLYISRSRLVMYVNGEQRICNDFGPERLTMAEAAVGFNDALYHSSAEHTELTLDFADRSGQLYYLQNTLYADQHTYDNVGFEEAVNLPGSFSPSDCYTHTN
mgnify:CR=1 FL=1